MFEKKLFQLISSEEIKKITKNCKDIPLASKVKIKVIKKYLDDRSYSLVALYDFDGFKFIGTANSDGKKEYLWKISKAIYSDFQKNKNFLIPKSYLYNKKFGIFFREYLEGRLLNDSKKEENIIFVKNLLEFFKTIKFRRVIKSNIFLNDIETNIKILDKRQEKNILKEDYLIIKLKINKYYKKEKNKIFVHGDFHPCNIFLNSSSLSLIDMEKSHFGLKEEDPANIIAHLKHSPGMNLSEREIDKWEEIIKKDCNKERFDVFEKYFSLLITSHIMVWGNYDSGLKLLKSVV